MATLDNWEHRTATPPIPMERQAEICSFCGALNRTLSRECFNCGWRPAFPEGDFSQDQSRQRLQFKTPLISLWWQHLKTWLHLAHSR